MRGCECGGNWRLYSWMMVRRLRLEARASRSRGYDGLGATNPTELSPSTRRVVDTVGFCGSREYLGTFTWASMYVDTLAYM